MAEGTSGVRVVWPEKENSADTFEADIIAVHGFTGDGLDTWTWKDEKSGEKICWITDLLPQVLQDNQIRVRVLSFSYPTSIMGRSVARIEDIAQNLLNGLKSRRRDSQSQSRPLIFISHSLGGIIAKMAINKAYVPANLGTHNLHSLYHSTAGTIFFGTPHRGGNFAILGQYLDKMLSLATHKPTNKLLADLTTHNRMLININDDFRHHASKLSVVSVYELEPPSWGKERIVEKDSAILDLAHEAKIGANADHSAMCKFHDAENETFRNVIDGILDIIAEDRAARKSNEGIVPAGRSLALKLPKIHVPPPLGQHVHAHFVERPDIMNTIDECFFKKQVTSKDSPDIYRLLLFGLPGSGKSQMAHHFFQQFYHRFWVNANTDAMAQQGFSSIGIKAGIAESIAADTTAAVVAWLEDLDNRWLLVLDDVHDINILSYLPRTGNGCVLITSKTEISRAASTTVKVNAFTPQQARQLLLRITKRPEPQGKESVIVDKLVQGLANLPLAVELVGASIKNKGISFEDYAASQNNERHMFGPRDKDTDFTGYSASLPETFDLTFELLSKSAPEVWPTARDLLYFFALLHPAGASTQIIEHTWLCMSRMINEGRLMVRPPSNWLRLLHPSQASEWENVLNTVQECLALLSKWSVLAFEGGANEHNVQIHSLVQKWIVQSMSSQEKRQWYATVATSLAVVWQHGKYNADLSPHLEHLASLFPNESIFDIPWSFAPQDDCAVASRWADIYSTSGYYNKAVQIRRTICNNVQASRKQGLSHLRLLAESWEKLAASWSDYGDHERALVAYVEAQRTAAPGYQKDKYLSRVYIRCIGYIGREYHISGENESALQKREEACRRWVDLGERLNSRDILEVDVFQAKRDFASSLIDIGKTQDAIKILERLIREKNQPVGINVINVEYEGDRSSDLDFDVLVTRSLLGHAYNEHRMHAQALEQHALVLRFQKQLSESHPDTLIAKENLAISYSSNGDHREAFRLRSEAIQQWAELKSQIPTSFRNLIAAKFNLAKSCEAMDYTERALEYYGEVLSFRLSAVEQRHDRLCKDPNCDTRRARDGKVILTCSHLLKEHHSSVQDAMETLEAIAFAKKKSNIATVGSDVEFLLRICNLKLKTGTPRSKRKALAFASRLASLSADVEEKIRRRKGILELQSHHLGGSDKDALDTALDIARNLHEAQRYKEADGYVSRVLHHQKVLKGAYPLFFEAARKLREQVLVEGTTRVSQSASNPEQTVSPHSSPRHIAVVSRPQPNLGQGGGQPVLIQQRAPADMQALEAILARMAPEPRPRAS